MSYATITYPSLSFISIRRFYQLCMYCTVRVLSSTAKRRNSVSHLIGDRCMKNKLCAWRHNMPRPAVRRSMRPGCCGPAAAHPLRLWRPARLTSLCGRHEY